MLASARFRSCCYLWPAYQLDWRKRNATNKCAQVLRRFCGVFAREGIPYAFSSAAAAEEGDFRGEWAAGREEEQPRWRGRAGRAGARVEAWGRRWALWARGGRGWLGQGGSSVGAQREEAGWGGWVGRT